MVNVGKKYTVYVFVRGQFVASSWPDEINNVKVRLANALK